MLGTDAQDGQRHGLLAAARDLWPVMVLALALLFALLVFPRWKAAVDRGGGFADPFRIAGDLYFVGTASTASFLLTGAAGHVLIAAGRPGDAPLIGRSIAQLGFDVRDVKVMLASQPQLEFAGALAPLQQASGARLWISEPDADAVAAGGAGGGRGPMTMFTYIPLVKYAAPRVDHRFRDGETIRLGPLALTAHITPGLTPGCTTWSFPIRHEGRQLHVVHRCPLMQLPDVPVVGHLVGNEMRDEFERNLRMLRSLPLDIWVTARGVEWGRYRKFLASRAADNSVEPFIDPDGYRKALDEAEARFRDVVDAR